MSLAEIFGIPTAYAQLNTAGAQAQAQTTVTDFAMLAGKIFVAIILVGIAFAVAMMVRQWVESAIRAKQGDAHKELSILYGRIAFSTILVAGAIIALIVTGMPLQWFSGALGLGLAFAVQGPVTNFVAGILVLTNDKFSIGDSIKIGENTGKIVDITSRHTTLRGFDGAQITIPNVDILSSTVVCYTRNPARRVDITMSVSYDANLQQARDIILDVVKKHHGVEPEPGPSISIGALAASSIDLNIKFWVDPHSSWFRTKDEITQQILAALYDAGITAPYPIQTLRVEKGNSNLLADALPFLTRDISAAQAAMQADVLAVNPYLATLKEEEAAKENVFETVPTESATDAQTAPTPATPVFASIEPATPTINPTSTDAAAQGIDTGTPAASPAATYVAEQTTPAVADTPPNNQINPSPEPLTYTQPIFQPGIIPAQPR